MKKIIAFSMLFALCAHSVLAAPLVRRADVVAAAPAERQRMDAGGLITTALGMGMGIWQLTQEQQTLAAECRPSEAQIEWLNRMMREWARAGGINTMAATHNQHVCRISFAEHVRQSHSNDFSMCHPIFPNTGANAGMIWQGFPMAAIAYRCTDETAFGQICPLNRREYVTNAFEVWTWIGFSDNDFIGDETNQLARWREFVDRCGGDRLNARRQEMWGNFMMQQAAGIGQQQDLGSIMGQVSGVMGQGGTGPASTLLNLAPALTQNLLQ